MGKGRAGTPLDPAQFAYPNSETQRKAFEARWDAIRAAFPRRPLVVQPPRESARAIIGLIFWALLLNGVALAGFILPQAPPLATDIALVVSGAAVPMSGATFPVPRRSCRSFGFPGVYACSLHLTALGIYSGAMQDGRDIDYMYFGSLPASDEAMRVMGRPATPQWLTTDHALARLPGRIVLFFLVLLVWAGVNWVLVISRLTYRLRIRRKISGRQLEPVAIRCHSASAGRYGVRTVFNAPPPEYASKTGRRTSVLRADPIGWVAVRGGWDGVLFPLDPDRAEAPLFLGVTVPGSRLVFALDRALGWLDLTPPERDALWRAAQLPSAAAPG